MFKKLQMDLFYCEHFPVKNPVNTFKNIAVGVDIEKKMLKGCICLLLSSDFC